MASSGQGKDPLFSTWVTPEGLRDQGADMDVDVVLVDWWFGQAAAPSPDAAENATVARVAVRRDRSLPAVFVRPPLFSDVPTASGSVPFPVRVAVFAPSRGRRGSRAPVPRALLVLLSPASGGADEWIIRARRRKRR